MKLLLIDTCGTAGSVALGSEAAVLRVEELPGRTASERLVAGVRTLLDGQGWRLAELTAIVVVLGPGSFTGVRVGVSAAKGLSEASGVPVVGLSRLEVLTRASGCAQAALDAGRGEFFHRGADGMEALRTRQSLEATVAGGQLGVCEPGAAERLEGPLALRVVAEPGPAEVLGLALERVRAGCFDDVATLDANYVRELYAVGTPEC